MGKHVFNPSAFRSSCISTTTSARVILVLQLALHVAAKGTNQNNYGIHLNKCCRRYEMLSSDGRHCVEAPWIRNESTDKICSVGRYFSHWNIFKIYNDTVHSDWMRLWLPPDFPPQNIDRVQCYQFLDNEAISSVNASSYWDPVLLQNKDRLRNTVAFVGNQLVARPHPEGGYRNATYCVDAAPQPLGPFAMLLQTLCTKEECANKCCKRGQLLKENEGHWKCEQDVEGFWTPNKSSLTVFDPEFPYVEYTLCERPRLLLFEERYAQWARHATGSHHFHFYTWDTCFDFYRSSSGSLHEGVFYCEYSRITRGVYWLLRPLCFLSALLLLASLLSIACDTTLRRKTHGHCLFSHAACLFVFNVGQILYYIAISDRLHNEVKDSIPPDLESVCNHFALSMYFVLTSAWFWLTALCVNMLRGFRLQMVRANKGHGRRFLVMSTFAWGLPAALTITCSILVSQPDTWHTPSLMETRVCYTERLLRPVDLSRPARIPFLKSGTALFYYGPGSCLVVCNIICLALTLKKVQYLKRGNSVLHREEDQISLIQTHAEGNNPLTTHTATSNGKTRKSKNRSGITVDAKTIKLYIKMILLSGCVELLTEIMMWLTTHDNFRNFYSMKPANNYARIDMDLAYRSAGYVTDFFRAVIVSWLAAPEGGYLVLLRRLRRGKRETRTARAGAVGGRKQNVAKSSRDQDASWRARAHTLAHPSAHGSRNAPRQPLQVKEDSDANCRATRTIPGT